MGLFQRKLRVSNAERVDIADVQGCATADRKGDARIGVTEVHVGEYGKAGKAVLTGNDLVQQGSGHLAGFLEAPDD